MKFNSPTCPDCGNEMREGVKYDGDSGSPMGWWCDGCHNFFAYEEFETSKIDKETEAKYLAIVGVVLSDRDPLVLTIEVKDAWILVAALQLATRHPKIHNPLRNTTIEVARQIQRGLVSRYPEAESILEMGWRPEFDQE